MSTRYNTGNPIESTDVRDMSDNAKNLDEFSNSTETTFTDRFGVARKTLPSLISKAEQDIYYAVINAGFQPASFDFVTGGTLVGGERNKAVFNPSPTGDDNWYAWQGALPKTISPNSTPAASGGLGENAWKPVTNSVLAPTVRESIRRSYAEAGYNVAGTFHGGFTIVNANDVGIDMATGKGFTGPAGPVAAGTNPASGGFVDRSGNVWLGSSAVTSYGFDGEAVQSAIDATNMDTAAVKRGAIEFKAGSLTEISSQIEIFRKNILFSGNNAALSWSGTNTEAMFHIVDSSRVKFSDLVLLGNLATPPKAALFFDRTFTIDEKGTNESCVVDGLILGRRYMHDTPTGGSADHSSYALLQNGIVIGGIDGNNDEYVISNTKVHSCHDGANTGKGIAFLNTQSTWSTIRDTLVNDSDIGYHLGCNLHMYTVASNRCSEADIVGVRDLETWIWGCNSENSNIYIKSQGGASFFVYGGELQRNSPTPQTMLRWENGGSMVLEGVRVWNVQKSVRDTIYYRPGSAKGGRVSVKNCTIDWGDKRDTWDIDTSHSTGPAVEIDIDHGPFKFKTSQPYLDRKVTPPTILSLASGLVASGLARTPVGSFHNAAYQYALQGQHLTVSPETSSQIRARIFNVTGSPITLSPGRVRWMNLGDHIKYKGEKVVDVPVLTNNSGFTATIDVPGAQLGDFVAFSADSSSYINPVVTAYVSAPNVVSLRVHNATGGGSTLPSTTLRAAVLKDFGNFIATKNYTPSAIPNGSTTSFFVDVPGVQLGGHSFVSYSGDLNGLICTASVSANDRVEVVLSNFTGELVTLPSGYFRVMVAF